MMFTSEFEKFFDVYPRQRNKFGAYLNWEERLQEGYSPEDLILAAERYAEACLNNHVEQKFIKHPKTFLDGSKPFLTYLKGEQQKNMEHIEKTKLERKANQEVGENKKGVAIPVRNIYETKDYSVFGRLEGNRDVTAGRAQKIKKSMMENGYIFSPIAVNEKMQVIDGQGRLEALTELNLPVHYYVIPGAGRAECIALNIYGTPWGINDYIKSYVESGIESYVYLDTLMKHHSKMSLGVIVYAITGKESADRRIKDGKFTCTEDEFLIADRNLNKCESVAKVITAIPGNPQCVYRALIFAITHCELDEDRLFSVLDKNIGAIQRIGTMKEALEMLSDLYNFKCRVNRIYLYSEYDKFQRGKFGWYEKKWSQFRDENNGANN